MDDRKFGFNSVYRGGSQGGRKINIVAIHGLDATSPKTWVFIKKDGTSTNWLEDMLPKACKNANIYTYDWKANFLKNSLQASLRDHAKTFLRLLLDSELAPPKNKMWDPIIYIASCFGGLLLAEAISHAQFKAQESILNATVGIIFLGTPFKGSGAARVARWATHLSHSSGQLASLKLVQILQKGNDKLQDVRSDFLTTAKAFQIPLSYCCESMETHLLKKVLPAFLTPWVPRLWPCFYTNMLLVEPESASLDDSECIKLGVRHVCLNKFENEHCPEYRQVRSQIVKFQEGIPSLMESRTEALKAPIQLLRPPNPQFIGRVKFLEDILNPIHPKLSGDRDALTTIWGLEGMGKTEVALKVAHQLCEVKDENGKLIWSVFWVSASTKESLNQDYRTIARYLHLNMDGDRLSNEDLRGLVNEKLGRRPRNWLFVVDDARDWLEHKHLPYGPHGSILVTTGDLRVAQKMGNCWELGGLNEQDAIDLFKQAFHSKGQKKSPIDIDKEAAKKLVKDCLQLHPLAIKLASEYIARQGNRNGIKEYVQSWGPSRGQGSKNDWLIKHIVNKVFAISLDRVTSEDPNAFPVLGRIAFLDKTNIPISLLEGLKDRNGFPVSVHKVLDMLVSYSFLTWHQDPETRPNPIKSIDVHDLVQRAMKDRFKEEGIHDQKVTAEVISLGERLKLPTIATKQEWSMEIAHVESVLQQAEEACRNAEGNVILPRIFTYGAPGWYLYYVVGQMHLLLEDQEQAERYHQKALQLEQRDVTDTFFRISVSTEQATSIDAKRMDKDTTIIKADDMPLKEYLSKLSGTLSRASALVSSGSYRAAEDLLQQISQVAQDELGKTHPLAITALTRLGQAQSLQSDFKAAAKTFEEVLALQRQILPKNRQRPHKIHHAIFASLETLAFIYQSDGDYALAQERLQQAIKVLGDHLKDSHAILSCEEHLTLLLEQQG